MAEERIEWVRDPARLDQLERRWNRLAADEAQPFGGHTWFSSWWHAFGGGASLATCAVWRRSELVAMLPMTARGDSLRAAANLHTPLFQLPARDEAARRAAVGAAVGAAGTLEVQGLPAGATLRALRACARSERRLSVVEPWLISPIVELDGDLDSYRSSTHPKWLRRIASYGRKIERDHQAQVSLVESASDPEHELGRCFELEAAGWKGRHGTAILSAGDTARFYGSLGRRYAELGTLRISQINLDGRLVAFDIGLVHANRLWLLKTGYDEAFRALSPGSVLRLWVIERCFELGLDGVELLGGAEPWKLRFATGEREHWTFRCYRTAAVPLARYVYRRALRPATKRLRDAVLSGR